MYPQVSSCTLRYRHVFSGIAMYLRYRQVLSGIVLFSTNAIKFWKNRDKQQQQQQQTKKLLQTATFHSRGQKALDY